MFNGTYNSNSLDAQWKDWNINYIGLTTILKFIYLLWTFFLGWRSPQRDTIIVIVTI